MYLCGMKKVVVFFLLFVFTIQVTKSLWILTSFQINREYIATNLCINRFDKIPVCKGQCYLNNQLEKEQKNTKNNLTNIEKETIFIQPKTEWVNPHEVIILVEKKQFLFQKTTKYKSFLFSIENPPEMAS